jgi:hypothetical protein
MIELFLTIPAPEPPEYKVPAVYREYEDCIARRESNRRPEAVSPSGKYRGMYQFDDALADGSTWHILDWLGTWHPQPKKYANELRHLPMNKWPEQVQTAAFVAVLDGHDKDVIWSGQKHWSFGTRGCAWISK